MKQYIYFAWPNIKEQCKCMFMLCVCMRVDVGVDVCVGVWVYVGVDVGRVFGGRCTVRLTWPFPTLCRSCKIVMRSFETTIWRF